MKLPAIIILILLSISTCGQSLRLQLLKKDTSLKDAKIIKFKDDTTLCIAILIIEQHWWEGLSVIKFNKCHIVWTAKFDTPPSAQSILSARQIILKGIPNPVVEVFDKSHMGNGDYYLYELEGKSMRLLVSTRAVDFCYDSETEMPNTLQFYSRVFKGGQLKPRYIDINKDGVADIKLNGIIQIFDDSGKLVREYYAQKIFLYNKTKNKFIEDLKQRKGFRVSDD